ncbi:MAG: ATP-binding protein [Syntrophobacterales bacterium]
MKPSGIDTHTQGRDQALVELILEAAVEGIVFVNSNRTIGYINRTGKKIFRCSRQDDPLPTFADLAALLGFDPLEVAPEAASISDLLDELDGEDSVQDPLEQHSQSQRYWQQEATIFGVSYLVHGSPISSGPSGSGGTVLCFRDMRGAQQREQVISENLSFASHELITPITAIKNALDLLSGKRLGDLTDKQIQFLQLAARNVERLNNVVTAVLDLSQLEKRSLTLHLEEVNLAEPVERALATLKDLAQQKGIRLQKKLRKEYPPLLADADRLRQVVYNLVHNAIKFTPEGGNVLVSLAVVPRTKLSERLPSNDVVQLPEDLGDDLFLLTVTDDGVGIPAAYVKSIFAKFHQGEGPAADKSMRGSGLGLAIVKTVVESHGGAVWVESEPDKGSRFRVLLPELSRREYLIRTAAAAIGRAKVTLSSSTLIILKVVPLATKVTSDPHLQEEVLNLLDQVVAAARKTVRSKNDRIEILDPSLGTFSLLAEIDPKDVPALLNRLKARLEQQDEAKGQIHDLRLVWGMATYPKDVSTAAELVEAAMKAAEGPKPKVIHLGQG